MSEIADEIRRDLKVEIPSDETLGALYQTYIWDDPDSLKAYTDDLPTKAAMLARRRTDFPGVAVWHRGHFSGLWFVHDAQWYHGSVSRTAWTCGFVALEFRGPEYGLFREVQMAVVVERFFEIEQGVFHLFAGVMGDNRGGNAWAHDIGFTYVGRFPEWLPKNGVLVDHNIYCRRPLEGVLAWVDANRRSKGRRDVPIPDTWQ